MKTIEITCKIILLALIISSCAAPATPIPTSTATLPATRTLTPTISPTATRTLFPTFTITMTPSATDSSSSSCFNLEYSKQDDFDDWCGQDGNLMSHDLSWGAFVNWDQKSSMTVASKSGKVYVFYPTDYLLGDDLYTYSFIFPEAWSEDNQYLYFSSSISWDGGGICTWGFGPAGLFKLNVTTGQVDTILPLQESTSGYWSDLSLSPNGKYLVYNNEENTIIRNLLSGKETTIPAIENEYRGDYIWDENGDTLVYVRCHISQDGRSATDSEIIHYIPKTGKSKIILREDLSEINLASRIVTDQLEIELYRNGSMNNEYFTYVLSTHQTMTATPDLP